MEYFNVSKRAVHKDVTADLKRITTGLYGEINAVLQENNEERHMSVGVAAKRKYEKKRREKELR